MSKEKTKVLVVQVAALGHQLLADNNALEHNGLSFKKLKTVFPAVTCTAQAGFRTGLNPAEHGITGNGFFCKTLAKPLFWEQSAELVEGQRIWSSFRESGNTVGMLFWQQSLGESVDCLMSPAPIHKHHGGMIQSCYSKPDNLHDEVVRDVGSDFNLMHYWGPLASSKSSDWIASATASILRNKELAPDLCMTYLPALDYDLQRFGPSSNKAQAAVMKLLKELDILIDAARENGYEIIIYGDYAIEEVTGTVIFPNRAFYKEKLFKTRNIKGKLYPDFYNSGAFAIVDHQVANVYTATNSDTLKAIEILKDLDGIDKIMTGDEQKNANLWHRRSGQILITAKKGHWFAYPWWTEKSSAPDYASHVDIHSKPGYDPCELFFGWPPMSVSQDCSKIKGTHGRDDMPIAWASSCLFEREPATLIELAELLAKKLESNCE